MASTMNAQAGAAPTLAAAEEALLATTGIAVERHDIEANGLRLHYLTCGEGEPLLLLHGRGSASALFAPILPQLAEHRRVIALDLPGWGLSGKPRFTGTSAEDALRVWMSGPLALLDALGIEQVDVLGHSMGGFTALGLALEHGERIGRLALVDAGGLGTEMQMDVRLYFALGPERLHRLLGKRFTAFVAGSQGNSRHKPSEAQLDFQHAVLTQEEVIASGDAAFHHWINLMGVHLTFTQRLKEVEQPTLLLWGDHDTVVSYATALRAARYLPHAQLVALTGCGHSPYTERPDDFAHMLVGWLDGYRMPSRV